MRYRIRPFRPADLDLVRPWLRTPEAISWWGDPVEQEALIAEDIDEPMMRQWIIEFDDQPFAYAQDYEAHSWPQPHLDSLPAGTRVIDAFIGDPERIGIGHGRTFLRQLANVLIADGAPAVAIDPAQHNARARRAYAGAGFIEEALVETEAGPAVLMVYRRS